MGNWSPEVIRQSLLSFFLFAILFSEKGIAFLEASAGIGSGCPQEEQCFFIKTVMLCIFLFY